MPKPWILFDLGGVFIELDFPGACARLAQRSHTPPETIALLLREEFNRPEADYGLSELAVAGAIDAGEYLRRFAAALDGRLDEAAIAAELGSVLHGVKADTVALAQELKDAGYRLACMSNVDELHWRHIEQHFDFIQLFERRWCSFQQREVKPHPAAYAQAARLLDASPSQIVFTDDRADNVAAAALCGLRALRFTDAATLRGQLVKLGLLN